MAFSNWDPIRSIRIREGYISGQIRINKSHVCPSPKKPYKSQLSPRQHILTVNLTTISLRTTLAQIKKQGDLKVTN